MSKAGKQRSDLLLNAKGRCALTFSMHSVVPPFKDVKKVNEDTGNSAVVYRSNFTLSVSLCSLYFLRTNCQLAQLRKVFLLVVEKLADVYTALAMVAHKWQPQHY